MVMECRGVDSSLAAADQQVSPETCWTQTPNERFGYSTGSTYPAFRMDRYATTADRGFSPNQPDTVPDDLLRASRPTTGCPMSAPTGRPIPAATPAVTVRRRRSRSDAVLGSAGQHHLRGGRRRRQRRDRVHRPVGSVQRQHRLLVDGGLHARGDPDRGDQLRSGRHRPVARRDGGRRSGRRRAWLRLSRQRARTPGAFAAGELQLRAAQPDFSSTTGQYWWSASNWRNRIAVPLTFATASDVCNTVIEPVLGPGLRRRVARAGDPAVAARLLPQLEPVHAATRSSPARSRRRICSRPGTSRLPSRPNRPARRSPPRRCRRRPLSPAGRSRSMSTAPTDSPYPRCGSTPGCWRS